MRSGNALSRAARTEKLLSGRIKRIQDTFQLCAMLFLLTLGAPIGDEKQLVRLGRQNGQTDIDGTILILAGDQLKNVVSMPLILSSVFFCVDASIVTPFLSRKAIASSITRSLVREVATSIAM